MAGPTLIWLVHPNQEHQPSFGTKSKIADRFTCFSKAQRFVLGYIISSFFLAASRYHGSSNSRSQSRPTATHHCISDYGGKIIFKKPIHTSSLYRCHLLYISQWHRQLWLIAYGLFACRVNTLGRGHQGDISFRARFSCGFTAFEHSWWAIHI